MPALDRPYEKFEKLGVKYLTDAELLAIIIKSGSKELNCLDIARYILSKHENGLHGFRYLAEASVDELMKIKGIGKVKAIQMKAIVELASRINDELKNEKQAKITSAKDVFNLLSSELAEKKVEEVRVIILDNKCFVKSVITVSVGATNKSAVSPKEIFSEPIKQLATSIILVHNHPSGDTTPSRQDVILTRKICDYARLFDIELLDHIIIGKNNYTSMKSVNGEAFLGGKSI